MDPQFAINEIRQTKKFFDRSTEALSEEDSGFVPAEGAWTVAQQVAHVAQTIDWLLDGMNDHWEMDFEKLVGETLGVTSLSEARAWLERSFNAAEERFTNASPEYLSQALAENEILGTAPRYAVVGALVDHTAHHRGALALASRIAGKTPAMPYM